MDQRPFLSHHNSPSFNILPCIRLQSAILHTGMRTVITLDSYMPFGLLSLARGKAAKYSTVIRRLTTGIRSEKFFVRRFRRCANVIECT
jgi:hypothetical protein